MGRCANLARLQRRLTQSLIATGRSGGVVGPGGLEPPTNGLKDQITSECARTGAERRTQRAGPASSAHGSAPKSISQSRRSMRSRSSSSGAPPLSPPSRDRRPPSSCWSCVLASTLTAARDTASWSSGGLCPPLAWLYENLSVGPACLSTPHHPCDVQPPPRMVSTRTGRPPRLFGTVAELARRSADLYDRYSSSGQEAAP